jgi:hypothetical protein
MQISVVNDIAHKVRNSQKRKNLDCYDDIGSRPKKVRRGRQNVRGGTQPLLNGSKEIPSKDDILDALIGFLSTCSNFKERLLTLGKFLERQGLDWHGKLETLIAQNKSLFGIYRNPRNETVVFLRKPARQPSAMTYAEDPPYEPMHAPARPVAATQLTAEWEEDYTSQPAANPAPNRSRLQLQHRAAPPAPAVDLRARTPNQQRYLRLLERRQPIVVVVGPAGTGKTYVAVRAALRALLAGDVERVLVTRPAVAVDERLGYLPGSVEDKMAPYLAPVADILAGACEPAALAAMMRSGAVEVRPALCIVYVVYRVSHNFIHYNMHT